MTLVIVPSTPKMLTEKIIFFDRVMWQDALRAKVIRMIRLIEKVLQNENTNHGDHRIDTQINF